MSYALDLSPETVRVGCGSRAGVDIEKLHYNLSSSPQCISVTLFDVKAFPLTCGAEDPREQWRHFVVQVHLSIESMQEERERALSSYGELYMELRSRVRGMG